MFVGTEAAAATAVVIDERAPANPINFRADHPFMFVIRQRSTRSTLFMGRLLETAADGQLSSGFKSGAGDTYNPGSDTNGSTGVKFILPTFLFWAVIAVKLF